MEPTKRSSEQSEEDQLKQEISMDYDNTNRGALFKNKRKQTDNHPDYKGTIDVDGQEYWLSAWIKKSKAGETYMSLAVNLKEDSNARARVSTNGRVKNDPRDEIPF